MSNNFEKRRDRFEFFDSFENPLLNITFKLETSNFLPYCKKNEIPPFHFFLFQLLSSVSKIENFNYRIINGNIISINKLTPSYTVLGEDNLFNYTRTEFIDDQKEFIKQSLEAKKKAETQKLLINTGEELKLEDLKNHIFLTCLPWLDFTSIQHPVFKFKSADIPSIAWGKFTTQNDKLIIPFSVQAHHGFVDGFHINQLAELIQYSISKEIT